MENHEENSISNLLFVIFFLSSFNEQIAVVNVLLCTTLLIFLKQNNLQYKTIIKCDGDFTISYYLYCNLPREIKVRYYAEIEHWFKGMCNFNIIQRSMLEDLTICRYVIFCKSIIPTLLAFSSTIICKENKILL